VGSSFAIEYLGESETEFENVIGCLFIWGLGVINDEKIEDRRSRDTASLMKKFGTSITAPFF
jgi:hypothetical protein